MALNVLRHEHIVEPIGTRHRAAHADHVPRTVDQRRLRHGEQQRPHRRPAGGVQPKRTIGLHHVAMRAHPRGLSAAGCEIPLAADAIAARHGGRLRFVRRSPGDDRAWVGEDRAHRLGRQEGRDQCRAVGDEHVPADRAVVPADFLDRAQIDPGLHLVAIDRARQQHAAYARGVQLRQQRLGDALGALDLIGGSLDRRAKFARPRCMIVCGRVDVVHAALAARRTGAVNLRPQPPATRLPQAPQRVVCASWRGTGWLSPLQQFVQRSAQRIDVVGRL